VLLVPLLYPPLSERALQRLLLPPLFLQARDQTLHLDREDAAAGGGLAGWVRRRRRRRRRRKKLPAAAAPPSPP
jgi:hypothetical protein